VAHLQKFDCRCAAWNETARAADTGADTRVYAGSMVRLFLFNRNMLLMYRSITEINTAIRYSVIDSITIPKIQ
jgi:hypothetical protein